MAIEDSGVFGAIVGESMVALVMMLLIRRSTSLKNERKENALWQMRVAYVVCTYNIQHTQSVTFSLDQ